MRKDEFLQAAVLAVLPACATYGLNGLNEAIKHEEDKLVGEKYPEAAIARRILPQLEKLQQGAYNSVITNAVALAQAAQNAVFATAGSEGETRERFTPLSRAELDQIKSQTNALAHAKREEAERRAPLPYPSPGMAEGQGMPSPLCRQDGEGLPIDAPDDFCPF